MDSRFHLTVKFRIYGEEYDWDCSLNWSGTDDRIDRRITEWFLDCHDRAYYKWCEKNADHEQQRRLIETEAHERAQLERLKAKYEK
jgi:hypothetical protein